MFVIRSSDGEIHWVNSAEYLREHTVDTKLVVFQGNSFTAGNVVLMKNRILRD